MKRASILLAAAALCWATNLLAQAPDLTLAKSHAGNFAQGQPGTYTLTVSNVGGSPTIGSVNVIDGLPDGLVPAAAFGTGWTCNIMGQGVSCNRSDPLAPGQSYPAITLAVGVQGTAPASVTNTAIVFTGGDTNSSNNIADDPTTITAAANLTITKSHAGNFTQGQTGTYTLTVSNTGGSPTNGTVLVIDSLPAGLTSIGATGAGWSSCTTFCTRSDPLAPGASYPPLTLTVAVAANAPPSVTNTATVSGGGDVDLTNNSASDPTAIVAAADLTISKTHTGNFAQGQPGTYALTVRNVGGSPTSGSVTVVDELPAGLVPATAIGTGWTCSIAAQEVTCNRSDALAPGQSYPAITLGVGVQGTAPASVTNTAVVFGGGEVDPSNNTAPDPTTITAGANLTITKSHTGNFTQGQTGTYTLTVSNIGGSPTNGTVLVVDSLPAGLTPAGATGTGWSCTTGGLCTRSDPLAPGASHPPITLTVAVAANAPASVTNTANVAGGADIDSTNNAASDPTTIIAVADLTISKTHTGSFLQGQVGAQYQLSVSNIGGGPTNSPVTVNDTVPAGLTPTAAAGAGWVCNIAGQNVGCSRSDALNAGASYPVITLTVNVVPAAPPSLTNTATVSGGGEINTANDTASDITTIGPGPDLTINKSHAGNFTQGQAGATFTITVSNPGSAPTTGVVTVTDNVPAGLVPTSAAGAGWTCNISGQVVTCTRSDPLATGQSYPITLTVNVPGAPGSVTNAVSVSGGGDVNPANNSATDVTAIVPGADLTITKTHTGNFTQGQTGATYTVTVTNSGVGPTTALVTVTDTLPVGLTPTAATGAGWSCAVGAQAVVCSRSDALAAGASYPPITITLNVAANAPPTVTNIVGVSGGGDSNAANNTASDATTIVPGPDLTIAKSHTGNFTQGQPGSYSLTVRNVGGSPDSGSVTVTDNVPIGLVPTSAAGAGWTCNVAAQGAICNRSDPLAPGQSYPSITLTVNVQPGAPGSVTNAASVSGGGDVNPANNSATDVTTIVPGADLTITKSHTGNFAQGQTGTYTLTVSNTGGSPTSGPVTVTDILPLGLTPTAATGAGWSCTVGAREVGCSRSDALAAGASYPPITITLNVGANAPPTVTNTAQVSGGGDSNAANNTASDATTIVPGTDLTIAKSHTGNFTQAQTGATYTITVSNTGGAPTTGTVTVTDTLPTGLTATALSGAGWNCTLATATCTRSDTLNAGASYPPITITVDVALNAPASVTNAAQVAGGGDVGPSANAAIDPTTIIAVADLTLTKTHTGSFLQGQVGVTYTLTASNIGGGPTSSPVTVNDTLPAGLMATSAAGAGWTCSIAGQHVTCSRSDALPAGSSYPPVTLTVNVALTAPRTITNTATVSGGGDATPDNSTASDATTILAAAVATEIPTLRGPALVLLLLLIAAIGAAFLRVRARVHR